MIYFSHRGNLNGVNSEQENDPEYIDESINQNFKVEIDVRIIDDELWLGHDKPQYKIPLKWLINRKDNLLIHIKNFEALKKLTNIKDLHIFWHQNDDYTITSKGYIWSHIDKHLSKNFICALPEISNRKFENCYGVCSDYIMKCRENKNFCFE